MPPKINDGLTKGKRWKLRHPEQWAKIKNNNQRKNWALMSAEERTDHHLRKRYKLSREAWLRLFEDQNYKCAICSSPITTSGLKNSNDRGVVDHDHTTGIVRGILCHPCNRALGLIKEDKEALKNMIEYLS